MVRVTGLVRVEMGDQRCRGVHPHPVHRGDDVAAGGGRAPGAKARLDDPYLFRGAAGGYPDNVDAVVHGQAQAFGQLGIDVGGPDAEPGRCDQRLGLEPGEDVLEAIHGYGEPYTRVGATDGGYLYGRVDADHGAGGVEQRPPRSCRG